MVSAKSLFPKRKIVGTHSSGNNPEKVTLKKH